MYAGPPLISVQKSTVAFRRCLSGIIVLAAAIFSQPTYASYVGLVDLIGGVSSYNRISTNAGGYAVAQAFKTDSSYYQLNTIEFTGTANTLWILNDEINGPAASLNYTSEEVQPIYPNYDRKFHFGQNSVVRPNSTYWFAFSYLPDYFVGASTVDTFTLDHGIGYVPKFALSTDFNLGSKATWQVFDSTAASVHSTIPTQILASRLGDTSSNPVPFDSCDTVAGAKCIMHRPVSGFWYAGVKSSRLHYAVTSSSFANISIPSDNIGYKSYQLIINNTITANLNPGESFDFIKHGLLDLTMFDLRGIDVGSEPIHVATFSSDIFATPVLIDFAGSPDMLIVQGISAVPEPRTLTLSVFGILVVLLFNHRLRNGSKSNQNSLLSMWPHDILRARGKNSKETPQVLV